METKQGFNLATLNVSIRALFTGYLLVIGIGLLVAGGQILLTHGMADGKFGLSIDDIVYSYYGDKQSSKLENKLNGSMQDKAPRVVKQDIIKWVRNGASESLWQQEIKQHFDQYCVQCHGVIPGLPDFTQFAAVKLAAKTDEGASVSSLTRVSHIHLFGIAFIFFFVGLIFSLAIKVPIWLKTLAIITPFVFLIIDVLSWWLTRIHPGFALLTLVGGAGYTLASVYMWCTAMWQMWWYPYRGIGQNNNAWQS